MIYCYTSRKPRLNRFPDSALTTALQAEFQQIIPLLTIAARDGSTVLYVSNQRCTIDNQLFLPRMLDWSGVSQTLGESSDAASFNFGNSDHYISDFGVHLAGGAPVQTAVPRSEVVSWEDADRGDPMSWTARVSNFIDPAPAN